MIDLRSDTVTSPCPEMRMAMANAKVSDDVIDTDPTVQRLQNLTAELLGKEDAVFMPSGTMTNQVALRLHCKPGDEFICEEGCHIYNYEQGAFAQLSGLVAKTIRTDDSQIRVSDLQDRIRPDNEHEVRTKLLTLENTHNRGGGRVQQYDNLAEVCSWAHKHGMRTHLDGARLFNAVAATGISAETWSSHFETVSVCFSKGLGAPVGSALAGPNGMIAEVRRHRKLFGGGMRQSGIIAAGALFALQNNIERLKRDHETASIIAEAVQKSGAAQLEPAVVDSNIVIFRIDPSACDAATFCEKAKSLGVWMLPFSALHVRAVTHLHITPQDAESAAKTIQQIL